MKKGEIGKMNKECENDCFNRILKLNNRTKLLSKFLIVANFSVKIILNIVKFLNNNRNSLTIKRRTIGQTSDGNGVSRRSTRPA